MVRKIGVIGVVILAVILTNASVFALQIHDPSYRAETYVTYTQTGLGRPEQMTFDSAGNLYITHVDGDAIYRVDSNKAVTPFIVGLNSPMNVIWGGGSAFGDNLFVSYGSGSILKVTPGGTITSFASGARYAEALGIDRTDHYGGYMYVGSSADDHIDKVTSSGTVTRFTDWPYGQTTSFKNIEFDPGTMYGGLMYTGFWTKSNPAYSGIFSVNTNGQATHFASDMLTAVSLEFDTYGRFGGKLFVTGENQSQVPGLYRVEPSGQINVIATPDTNLSPCLAFGPDGAMYVMEWSFPDNTGTVYRIIPEPGMLSLMVLGVVGLARRRRCQG